MSFADDVYKFAEMSKQKMDQVVRRTEVLLAQGVVMKSPVGNAELWAANSHASYGRANHNLWAAEINAQIDADSANFTKSGNLKGGVKRAKRASKKTLDAMYPLQSGKGYVGGRFRGNWQGAVGAPAEGVLDTVDPSGRATLQAILNLIATDGVGGVLYVVNNLPYAQRLEVGWSGQAPSGMVAITMAEFQDCVKQAIQDIK